MRPSCLLFIAILGMASCLFAQSATNGADSWPDFRGPERNGHAPGASVPLEWDEKKNVAWKVAVRGIGWSSPIVQDGRVWMTSATEGGKKLWVVAVDAKSGKTVVDRLVFTVPEPQTKNALNSHASPSPAAEPGRVYIHFGTYGTACLDTKSGKTVWERRDLNCEHGVGPGSTPIVHGELLIFDVDGMDVQYVIALDKKTGKTRWKTKRSVDFGKLDGDFRKAYGTPVIYRRGKRDVLVSPGAQAAMAYDAKTGEELWRVRYKGFSQVVRPVIGDGLVYLNTGFVRPVLLAVALDGSGDVTDTHIKWKLARSIPTMPSPVFIDGRLYVINDNGTVSCLDGTSGKRLWRHRLPGEYCSSLLYAGGRIHAFNREGTTTIFAPGEEFRQLAVNELADGFMASPAVVGRSLFLRTKTTLYRVETPSE